MDIENILKDHLAFTTQRNWNQFQNPKNLSMALSVEAAELVEVFMWLNEQQAKALDLERKQQAKEEIADIFIYLIRIAHALDIDIIKAAEEKMLKNKHKYPVDKGLKIAEELSVCCKERL